jgi:hypothetical protein
LHVSEGQPGQPAEPSQPAQPEQAAAADEGAAERAGQHARKLEQIKDLYLTAEAIGEANVDKHFDQLLAQQRELIGDYIKQSKAALQEPQDADRDGDSGPHPVTA